MLLPPKDSKYLNMKTLVLDLDETLVHSDFNMFEHSDLVLKIEFENMIHNIHVLIRPGVDNFLNKMSKIFEIVIFTASLSKYADPLLDIIDKDKRCIYRLFREHCTLINGVYVKDLKRLNRDLKEVIIVDNSPLAYAFNKDNGLPITSWYEDKTDNELEKITPYLEFLSKTSDVRKHIPKMVENNIFSYEKAQNFINSYNLINEQFKGKKTKKKKESMEVNNKEDSNLKLVSNGETKPQKNINVFRKGSNFQQNNQNNNQQNKKKKNEIPTNFVNNSGDKTSKSKRLLEQKNKLKENKEIIRKMISKSKTNRPSTCSVDYSHNKRYNIGKEKPVISSNNLFNSSSFDGIKISSSTTTNKHNKNINLNKLNKINIYNNNLNNINNMNKSVKHSSTNRNYSWFKNGKIVNKMNISTQIKPKTPKLGSINSNSNGNIIGEILKTKFSTTTRHFENSSNLKLKWQKHKKINK